VRGPHAADAPLIVADLDALDLSRVRLPHDTAYYQPIDGRSDKLRADSGATFAHPAKKELVYYDGQVDVAFDCGHRDRGVAAPVGPRAASVTARPRENPRPRDASTLGQPENREFIRVDHVCAAPSSIRAALDRPALAV